MKRLTVALLVCVFALCVSCDENALLRDYVNDHVVSAAFGGVEVAAAESWTLWESNPPDVSEIVDQLRSLNAERGRAVVLPGLETVLKITLNNERGTVYEPEFVGADAELVDLDYRRDGSSVFYVKLGPAGKEGPLDITLRLKAPPAHKPPGDMPLPIESVLSSGAQVTITPSYETYRRTGSPIQFRAAISDTGIAVNEGPWEWKMLGSDGTSTITASGNQATLTVGAQETALTVMASLQENPQIWGTAAVLIPTVTRVRVVSDTTSVMQGKPLRCYALVQGSGLEESDKAVTWTVKNASDGSLDGDTDIDAGGVLTVATNEMATTLTVTATSEYNTAKFGTATVNVSPRPVSISQFSGDPGTRDSAIDLIEKWADADSLFVTLEPGPEESVDFGSATEDLEMEGLFLTTDTSPASVTINGGGRVVDLTGWPSGSPLITVGPGVTLTLRNITFKGLKNGQPNDTDNNNAPLIKVNGGTLILEDGANIRDNANGSGNGGGVYVGNGGNFMMTGGEISGNEASVNGGGVYVDDSGEFTMSGSAVVNENNVVYLASGRAITVGALTGSRTVAKIEPETQTEGTVVLEPAGGVTLNQAILSRFTPPTDYYIYLDGPQGKITASTLSSSAYPSLKAAVDAVPNRTSGDPVTIVLTSNVNINSSSDKITLNSGKHIKLVPDEAGRTVKRTVSGYYSLFTVASGASLTLAGNGDKTLTIDGGAIWNNTSHSPTFYSSNDALRDGNIGAAAHGYYLIEVSGGVLTMEDGVILQNNDSGNVSGSDGGAVRLSGNGVFSMTGGVIQYNTAIGGGGVALRNNSNNTMIFSGGEIRYNVGQYGGGINVDNGSLVMSGEAEVSGNKTMTVYNSSTWGRDNGGGGVFVKGTFNMSGGTIAGNYAHVKGGGVSVDSAGTFTKTGGTIYGSNASDNDKNTAPSGKGAASYKAGDIKENTF